MQLTKMRTALLAVSATAGAIAMSAPVAHAQFSTLTPPSQGEGTGTAASSTTAASGSAGKNGAYSVTLFPFAPFQQGFKVKSFNVNTGEGSVPTGDIGDKTTTNGILIAPEAAFANKNGKGGYGFGAWYWARTDKNNDKAGTDLFDVHGKYFITKAVGVQLGYLGNVNSAEGVSKQQGVNLYATYNYASQKTVNKNGGGGFGANVGLGVQQVSGTDEFSSSAFFTGFVAASYDATKALSVNLSYWFWSGSQDFKLSSVDSSLTDKVKVDFNLSRVALGVGYKF